MVDFKVVTAKESDLETLYNNSALTIEGLRKDSIKDWVKVLEEFFTDEAKEKGVEILIIPGKLMNDHYGLTGNNAYPDDLSIVAFKTLDYFKDDLIGKLAIDRMSWGGRWFDDIVENNVRREKENAED